MMSIMFTVVSPATCCDSLKKCFTGNMLHRILSSNSWSSDVVCGVACKCFNRATLQHMHTVSEHCTQINMMMFLDI